MKELLYSLLIFISGVMLCYKYNRPEIPKVEQCQMDTIHIKEIISRTPENKEAWQKAIDFFISEENIAKAERFWKEDGVLPSAYLAHAALETGFGESRLVKRTNNRGNIKTTGNGIRAYDKIEKSHHKYAIFPTHYDGEKAIIELFKRFKSTRDVLGETDYLKWTRAIELSPYSTDEQCEEKLNSIIKKFSLYNLDHAILREDRIVDFKGKILSYQMWNPFFGA